MKSNLFLEQKVNQWMDEALIEAQKANDRGEVPVGAVLVYKERIIARAFNQMESLNDPSAHAEILCIRTGAQVLGDWRLIDTILYTTLEPCLMCAGALLLARVKKVIWGAHDVRHGANGSFLNVFAKKHPTHTIEIQGGVRAQEAGQLIKNFFKRRRNEKKNKTII